jgi:hyperosmotically inducible periplasmic protein
MKGMRSRMIAVIATAALAAASAFAGVPTAGAASGGQSTSTYKEIRKKLVTLPYYGVFDNLAFKVNGNTVTLYGQVVRPSTRQDAARRVAKIEGIDRVINNIEVLPLSSFDDSIRARTYRAVFNAGGLYRYAQGANPSVHIVVNRGRVTLEGVVATKMDSQLAYMAANGVSGVFSVKNNLRVERDS